MCMCRCDYIYRHICIVCGCIYTHTCKYVCVSVCVYMCAFIYTCVCICVCALSCFSHVQIFATLWTAALQAPLSMGFF